MVEGDGASFSGVRVLKPVRRLTPGTGEFWDGEGRRARATRRVPGDQRRLFRKVKGNLHSTGNVGGRHMKLILRLQERVVQSLNPFAQLPFRANESASACSVGFCGARVESGASPEHDFFDLAGDDGADAAEVFADRFHLAGGSH